jgi:hypothetical protein
MLGRLDTEEKSKVKRTGLKTGHYENKTATLNLRRYKFTAHRVSDALSFSQR